MKVTDMKYYRTMQEAIRKQGFHRSVVYVRNKGMRIAYLIHWHVVSVTSLLCMGKIWGES